MIPIIFTAVDKATARDAAREHADKIAAQSATLEGPLTVSEIQQVRDLADSPMVLPVACVDGVSPAATEQLLSLVRDSAIVGYSTKIHESPGIHIERSGLRTDDDVFLACMRHGMTSAEAAQCARMGRGSIDTALSSLGTLSARTRIIKMLDAIRAHDMSAVCTAAGDFTGEDIALLRTALHEIDSGQWAVWTSREVEILQQHKDFVAYTISDYYVTVPASAAMTLGLGLYFAECGLVS